MGYQSALEAAGVEVEEFREFGSYQGTWIAILKDGRVVEGSYGSCSGCDAFQAEFDYSGNDPVKLAAFGNTYLDTAESFSEILKRYKVKCEGEYPWNEDLEILEWLKEKSGKSDNFKTVYDILNEP